MRHQGIAIFGSSETGPGDPLYAQAREAGASLARAGFRVVTGGYTGVMEAASRGANEVGGSAIGVCCDLFADRSPNRYLTQQVDSRDLFERTRLLVEHSNGFLVMQGKAGTLAELAFLWALERAGCLNRRPVVLLGTGWKSLLGLLATEGILDPERIETTVHARTVAEAVEALLARLGPGEDRT